jgi:hypothetical protein
MMRRPTITTRAFDTTLIALNPELGASMDGPYTGPYKGFEPKPPIYVSLTKEV